MKYCQQSHNYDQYSNADDKSTSANFANSCNPCSCHFTMLLKFFLRHLKKNPVRWLYWNFTWLFLFHDGWLTQRFFVGILLWFFYCFKTVISCVVTGGTIVQRRKKTLHTHKKQQHFHMKREEKGRKKVFFSYLHAIVFFRYILCWNGMNYFEIFLYEIQVISYLFWWNKMMTLKWQLDSLLSFIYPIFKSEKKKQFIWHQPNHLHQITLNIYSMV